MARPLPICIFVCCFFSCRFTTENSGQLFVNQRLIESKIQSVQPAAHIDLSVQTTNGHDSILIVKLTVDPKIPNDSLNLNLAKQILASFLTILPNMTTFTACKILFTKQESSFESKTFGFICLITPELVTRLATIKDSTRTSRGYVDPHWNYINPDLNLSLSLQSDWYYNSDENDSMVFYSIGSDINQLPQYRTETDRKVTFQTLSELDPGVAFPVLQISKNDKLLTVIRNGKVDYHGPLITVGLVMNMFDSEDEYLKNLYELAYSKKLSAEEIRTFHFGNADFRGHQFRHEIKNGQMANYLFVIKRFRKVTLVLNLIYSNDKEFEEIRHELSGLKIN